MEEIINIYINSDGDYYNISTVNITNEDKKIAYSVIEMADYIPFEKKYECNMSYKVFWKCVKTHLERILSAKVKIYEEICTD